MNYSTTEKKLLIILFTFKKFPPYLLSYKTIVHTDHAAIRYLFAKMKSKPRLD